MRSVVIAAVCAALSLVAGCSDDSREAPSDRFPGFSSTTLADSGGSATTSSDTVTAPSAAPTSAPPVTVPRPGMGDALAVVEALFRPSELTPTAIQAGCIANELLDRITEASLPDIARMSRDQYPPGLANDLNAALTECLPDKLLAKVII